MTLLTILSGLTHIFTLWFCLHPIHVSVTEIEFDRKDQALEIMMRVFIDDFELTLRNELANSTLDVLNPPPGTTLDQLAEGYLKKHFKLSLDGRMQKTSYLGHERESEVFIFYIEVTGVNAWKTITIQNEVIMRTYDDQSNIVHVFVDDDVKSLRLTRNTPADKLTF